MKAILLLLVLLLTGCPDDCDKGETRCSDTGNKVDICSSSNTWEMMMDCDSIEGGGAWVCCSDPIEGGFNCLTQDECGGDK